MGIPNGNALVRCAQTKKTKVASEFFHRLRLPNMGIKYPTVTARRETRGRSSSWLVGHLHGDDDMRCSEGGMDKRVSWGRSYLC